MLFRDFGMDSTRWAWFSARGDSDPSLLLFAIWDPIGVSDSAITADEYDSYVPQTLSYVRDDDAAGLAQYLRTVAREAMGLAHTELPIDAAQRVINGA